MKTHIVSILDRSGSMYGKEKSVIENFNNFVREQQSNTVLNLEETTFSLIIFDNIVEVIHNQIPLKRMEKITRKTYYTRGATSLLDAMGQAMRMFKKKDKVIVFVETDGQENSSREFTSNTIQKMVTDRKKRKWDFIFTGAGLSSFATKEIAHTMNIDLDKVMWHDNSDSSRAFANSTYTTSLNSFVASSDGNANSI